MDDREFQASQSTSNLANLVAGFSIVQNLVVIMSILEHDIFGIMICDKGQFWTWLVSTLLFAAIYLFALHFLFRREIELLDSAVDSLKRHAFLLHRARMSAVTFVFALVTLTGVGAEFRDICDLGNTNESYQNK